MSACALGIVQYWTDGAVSIRPGHEPVSGSDAVEALVILASVSVLFCAYGILLRYRARRAVELKR